MHVQIKAYRLPGEDKSITTTRVIAPNIHDTFAGTNFAQSEAKIHKSAIVPRQPSKCLNR